MKVSNNLKVTAVLTLTLLIAAAPALAAGQTETQENLLKKEKITKMYERYQWWFFPKAKSITVKELLKLMESGDVVLVDDRTQEEQDVSMIPSARNSVGKMAAQVKH